MAPVGARTSTDSSPAIASKQFEAIENRSQVAGGAVGSSDFNGFLPAIASKQFEAIENGSQVERSTAEPPIKN